MNAAVQIARDIGIPMHRFVEVPFTVDGRSVEIAYRVFLRVDYRSVYHRGRGLDPMVAILTIEREIGGKWVRAQLTPEQYSMIAEYAEGAEEVMSMGGG